MFSAILILLPENKGGGEEKLLNMEHRRGNDQECGVTNKEYKKNSSTESEEKMESSPEEESEEEVQSKETELHNIESNNCIDEEELSDEEEDELVDELSEQKKESVVEEIFDEKEEELGAGELSQEEEEKFSAEEISDEEEDEFSDEEISGEEEDEPKNLKNEEGMKNFKKKYRVVLAGPNPPPPIPPEFKNCIQEKSWGQGISFSDEILVIQKQLSETEISQQRSGLFIPLDFIRNKHFNDDELDELNNNNFIPVTIIDPLIKNVTVNLRRKLMIKNIGGEPSRAYVLNEDWDRIVTAKNLEEGDIVQLWAVRVGGNLCFLLVNLPKEGGESCGKNTSTSSGCDTHDSEAESPPSTENEDI